MNFRIFSRPELLQEFFSIRKYILSFFLLIENYYSFASAEAILATFSFYDSKRSIGFVRFLRLEEEYWFRAVFCFYDSKRSIGFVWFFYDSKRSIGFVWFLRLEEEYWFRMVFLVLVFFSSFWPWAFSLEALHWRAWYCFTHHSHIHSQIIHSHIHLQLKKKEWQPTEKEKG